LNNIIVAIDAMGGDHGPAVTVPASLAALAKHPHLHLLLVGDETVLRETLKSHLYDQARLTIHHASQQVGMDEEPASALRTKKDSSMRVAINLVQEGEASACVSAGNTGALVATARFVFKTLPGIDRPAIISSFPTIERGKKVRMLDLGANVDSSVDTLVQFAVMGSVLASAVDNTPSPSVYLLNIGEEEIKGNEQVKQTAQRLSQLNAIHYAGFIEGDAIFSGKADLVVCDGFVGNVALKASEGIAMLIGKFLKDAFNQNLLTRCLGILVMPLLKTLKKRIDPARYNGAMLIGLNKIVIKSHGGARCAGFANAIEEALIVAQKNVPDRIREKVQQLLHNHTSTDTNSEST
jgi:glycerol-3-phosphate acyltransferase PlsX